MAPQALHPRTSIARRYSTVLSSLLALAVAAVMAVAALAAPEDVVPTSRTSDFELRAQQLPSAQLSAFTLNVCFCLTAAQAEQDMIKAFTLGDVGGFQEFSDAEDRATLIRLATERDYGWYMPLDGSGTIPIVWNRARFRLLEGRTIVTHGSIPGVTPARHINVVRLREIATGKVFGIINTHTIAQASFDAQLTNPTRIPLLRQHLQLLRQAIVDTFATTEHVFAMGDLNVNYLADRNRKNPGLPTDALGDVVNFDMPMAGSRGSTSLLDYGMTVKEQGGFAKVAARIEPGFNSDHDAVVLTYDTVDLFATGAIFNRPVGSTVERRAVLTRALRAIGNTEAGSVIRLAVSRLDDADVTNALAAAAARGVAVQVLTGPGSPTGDEQALATALGVDQALPSWFRQCVGGCLGGAQQEANFLLVSQAGGASEVSYVLDGAPTAKSTRQWTDAYLTTDTAVYAGYGLTFAQMALDAGDTRIVRQVRWGDSTTAQLFPIPSTVGDPVEKTLKKVRCKTAAKVRATVRTWNGKRGTVLADRLVTMAEQGCDLRVILGQQVAKGVVTKLKKADITVVQRKIEQNVLVVNGRYKKATGTYAWVGGPGWGNKSLTSDGVTLGLTGPAAQQYLTAFYRVYEKE